MADSAKARRLLEEPPADKVLKEVRDGFLRTMGELASRKGIPASAGDILGLLFLSQRPLSLDEMSQMLGVSKGTVSNNVRLLERWKCVRKTHVLRERRDYYESRIEPWDAFTEALRVAVREDIVLGREFIDEAMSKLRERSGDLSPSDKRIASFYIKRLEALSKHFEVMEALVNLLLKMGKIDETVVHRMHSIFKLSQYVDVTKWEKK